MEKINIEDAYDLEESIANADADWNIIADNLYMWFSVPDYSKKKLAQAIGNSTTLKSLQLDRVRGTKIQPDLDWLCEALIQNKSLTKLTFNNIEFESKMQPLADALKQNLSVTRFHSVLSKFDFNTTKLFTDLLRENKTITKVDLCDFNVDDTIELWRDYLAETTTLKDFRMSYADITPERAKILFEGLKKNRSITTLDLFSNPLGEQLTELADIILSKPFFKRLFIQHVECTTPQGLEAICKLLKANQLDNFAINGCFEQQDEEKIGMVLDALQYDRTIKVFGATSIKLNDSLGVKLAQWLKKSRSIQKLRIAYNSLGEDACKAIGDAIKNHSSLELLTIGDNPLEGDSVKWICEGLKANSTLTDLEMSNAPMNISNIDHICEMLKSNDSLVILNLSSTVSNTEKQQIADKLTEAVLASDTIESLYISTFDYDSEQYRTYLNKLESNRQAKEDARRDWWVLSNNIARQNESFELFPSEIWLLIFAQVRYRGIKTFARITRKAFRKYKRMQ